MGFASEIYDQVWEHVEAQRWDKFMNLFSMCPEVKFQNGAFSGRDQTLEYFQGVMDLFPDIRHSITSVVESADGSAMAGWATAEAVATRPISLFGQNVDVVGKMVTFEAVDFLSFDKGKICAWWAMHDLERHMKDMNLDVLVRAKTN